MGKWSREFASQLFGKKPRRENRHNEQRRRNNDRDRAFVREQYNASRDHFKSLKKRR